MNGITLRQGKKVLEHKTPEGSIIKYKTIPPNDYRNWSVEYVKDERTKQVDGNELINKILAESIQGWENVFDEENQPVEFNKELIQYLPLSVQMKIHDLAVGDIVSEANKLKAGQSLPLSESSTT